MPKPKVDSAIILIDNISRDYFNDINEGVFFEVIK
jgi:16S rRNA A1518/A1519 N6-dimethyltransferase RsmA/KsgA/DIM1 with predicted DNA glycosylase/AP lyase activity